MRLAAISWLERTRFKAVFKWRLIGPPSVFDVSHGGGICALVGIPPSHGPPNEPEEAPQQGVTWSPLGGLLPTTSSYALFSAFEGCRIPPRPPLPITFALHADERGIQVSGNHVPERAVINIRLFVSRALSEATTRSISGGRLSWLSPSLKEEAPARGATGLPNPIGKNTLNVGVPTIAVRNAIAVIWNEAPFSTLLKKEAGSTAREYHDHDSRRSG